MTICDMLVTYPRTDYYTVLLPVIYEEDEEDDMSFIEEDTVDTCPAIIVPPLTYILIN